MKKTTTLGVGAVALAIFLWIAMRDGGGGGRSRASPARFPLADAAELARSEEGASEQRREPLAPAGEPVREQDEDETHIGAGTSARVRFVDEHGAPIAGVELRAAEDTAERTLSGADGLAELALDAALFAGEPRMLTFQARCPGFARERREATARPGERLLLGDWRLVDGGSVEGRVVDPSGRGLEGARVACLAEDDPFVPALFSWEARRDSSLESLARPGTLARTRRDGSFLLEDVPAGRIRLVAAAVERPAAASEPVDVPAGGIAHGVTIRMGAAEGSASIAGIVLDPDGRPVPRARVSLTAARTSYEVGAGEDGRFEVRFGDGDPRDVTAADPQQRYGEATLRGVPVGTADLELRLSRSRRVELAVRSPEGTPIERFAVALIAQESSKSLAFFREDERVEGVLAFAAPAQGFRIEVRANGWLPGRLGPFAPGAVPELLECRLAPAGGLSGVIEAGGKPLAGAAVALHAAVETHTTWNGFPVRIEPVAALETESDAQGRFSLSVEERGAYHVRAEAPGFAPAELGPLELDPSERREERIELTTGGSLAVQVHSQAGATVGGTLVALSRGDGRAFTARADDGGALLLERLTPGRWQVQIAADEIDPDQALKTFGGAGPRAIPSNCEVVAGGTTRVDLWLEDEPGGDCRLSGRLSIDGEPAGGWVAGLDREGASVAAPEAFVEPGVFRLAVAEPGAHRLTLRSADPRELLVVLAPVELYPGEQHWSLELETGALEGALGESVEGGMLFHRWQRGTVECLAPLVPGTDGRFRHTLLPAGRGTLVRLDPGRPLDEQTPLVLRDVTIEAGKTTTIE